MKRTTKKIAALLITALFAAQAFAAPVFDNGTASKDNGYNLVGDVTQNGGASDDFVLGAAATISSVGFYFNNYNGTDGWDGKISYAFFASSGNAPGAILASGDGVNVTELAGN